MQKTSKIFCLFLILIVVFSNFALLNINKVEAAVGIKISPLKVEDLVDPGETLKRSVKITNESSNSRLMYVYLKDFTSADESGRAKLIAPGSKEGSFMSSWIDVTVEGINFSPGETKEIPFIINVPASAGPGGYYGAIIFGSEPPNLKSGEADKGATVGISQQAGALILLQVSGDVVEQASIKQFLTDKELYSTPFDVNFLIRVKNSGNVHVKPHGTIVISNMFGKKTTVIRVNDEGSNVLPDSTRRFEELWSSDLGFGRYKAALSLSYGISASKGGQGKQSMYYDKYFWIIPWKIVTPIIFSLIVIVTLIVLFLKFYKSRAVKKAITQMGISYDALSHKKQEKSPLMHFGLIFTVLLVVFALLFYVFYFIFFA